MIRTYRPEFDGLRTVAVYLVVLFHSGLGLATGGFVGVDLFFVLSGFLVSSVILAEVERTDSFALGRFYARRARRLLPAAVVVVVAVAGVFTVLWSVPARISLVGDARSALLYYSNWHFADAAGDYFAADSEKSPFLHFWSLSIEEQFYVFFPMLVLLLVVLKRVALLRWIVGVLLVCSVAAQVHWAGVDVDRAYYGTDARLYQLLAGVLLALALQRRPELVPRRAAVPVGWLALVALLVLGSGLLDVSASWRGLGACAAAVVLLGALAQTEGAPLNRVLGTRVPVFLGKISYGTYLWHWPVIVALTTVLDSGPVVVAVLAAGVSTGLAALSYEVLEMPIRKAAVLDRLRWSSVAAGLAVSALVAAVVAPGLLNQDRRPELAAAAGATSGAPGGRASVPADIDWKKVVNDHGAVQSCTAEDVDACRDHRGAGPRVLLVGDSQAQMMVPMFRRLARDRDWDMSFNVLPGCTWQEELTNSKMGAEGAEDCRRAREGWYDDVLPQLDPDVVILLARPRDDVEEWGDIVSRRDGPREPLGKVTWETTSATLEKVSALVPHVLVVSRLVMPETFDPTDCLASASRIGQCSVPVPDGGTPVDGYVSAVAAEHPNVELLNLNPAFCEGAPWCLPVVGGQVVWRDDHHYTAAYVKARQRAVWRLLSETGAFGRS